MIQVLVVLTDGWLQAQQRPTEAAIARLRTMITEVKKTSYDEVAIIGGWPDKNEITLAEHYKDWLHRVHPLDSEVITIVDGNTNNTVDDIQGLVQILRKKYDTEGIILSVITSRGHHHRIVPTMKALRVQSRHIPSGEHGESMPTKNKLLAMCMVNTLIVATFIDPLWKSSIGIFFRKKANQRALQYRNSEQFV